MRSLRRNARGLSEIVGTLFLVLIVVGAATALAIFVAQYQKQLQAEQAEAHNRALESFTVVQPIPELNQSTDDYASVNFTLTSFDVNPSTVTELIVDGHAVRQYVAFGENLTTGSTSVYVVGPGGQLSVGPRGVYQVNVSFVPGPSYSFFGSFVLPASSYLEVDVVTGYLNDFKTVFLPPTAIGVVSPLQSWNGTAFVTVPVLDGSASDAGANASLVDWRWTITPDNLTLHGQKVVANFSSTGVVHTIVLVVTDNYGLQSPQDTLRFFF